MGWDITNSVANFRDGHGFGRKTVIFQRIYTPAVLNKIAQKAKHDDGSSCLFNILTGGKEAWTDFRSHFEDWLQFAEEKDGLNKDRVSRLRSPNIFQWQQAVSEIEVPYFFTQAFGLKTSFVENPMAKGEGEFTIDLANDRIVVEVKTPRHSKYVPWKSLQGAELGAGEDLIRKAFREAAKQMQQGHINLLVISTGLWRHIMFPEAFTDVLYGHEGFGWHINCRTGQALGPTFPVFDPNGELNKLDKGRPRHTRISAVAYFSEETLSKDTQEFNFTIFHNSHASRPLDPRVFPKGEQWLPVIEPGDEHKRRIIIPTPSS